MIAERLAGLGAPYAGERVRPDGSVLDVRRNPVPGGGFVSIYADVTEQRHAQALVELARARLVDAIESLSDGFALWDKDDRLALFNSRCREILDAPELFVVGTRFEELIRGFSRTGRYGHMRGDADGWIEERMALHRAAPSDCVVNLASGGWLHVREFRTQEGGTVTIWTDITATKTRERELEAARDEASEARRTVEAAFGELKAAQASLVHAEKMASLGQLTAGIAHEIKNPLNFVNNFAGLSRELLDELKAAVEAATSAADKADPAAADEAAELMAMLSSNLAKIVEHGRRADGIVRSMLLHSRGGVGERQNVDLNALIEEALNLAYHGARAQDQGFNAALARDYDPALAPLALVPQDMTRVFLNLFGNAFHATTKRAREGGDASYQPEVRVATRGLDGEVEVRVRDNGTGMAPEVRAKLFTPFFTTKPTGEGTGLGLSISYDIVVQQHGGSVAVDSREGEFAEFVIRLPRREESRAAPAARGAAA
jgi:signal transduction histidine kinase